MGNYPILDNSNDNYGSRATIFQLPCRELPMLRFQDDQVIVEMENQSELPKTTITNSPLSCTHAVDGKSRDTGLQSASVDIFRMSDYPFPCGREAHASR